MKKLMCTCGNPIFCYCTQDNGEDLKMKLDKFQQFIKDGDYDSNLNTVEAKALLIKLTNDFKDQYDYVASCMPGIVGYDEIFSNAVYSVESLNIKPMDNAMTSVVNDLIKTTLEEIEDIEYVGDEDESRLNRELFDRTEARSINEELNP